jgi:hypothetical protein
MLEHDLTKETTLRLFAFGSDDGMKLTLNSPDSKDPAFGGAAGIHQGFWRVQGRVDTRPTDKVRWTTTFSVGQTTENTNIGGMYQQRTETRDMLISQHRDLYLAIIEGRAEQARDVSTRHLLYVQEVLEEVRQEVQRVARAERRKGM